MIDSFWIMAAFAVFLIPKETRFPALLCLAVEVIAYQFESLPNDDTFRFYFYACGVAAFLAGIVILNTSVIHSILFLCVLANSWLGYFLYMNYYEPTSFNFIGLYVILTQLMIMLRDGSGGIRNVINDTYLLIRHRLSI